MTNTEIDTMVMLIDDRSTLLICLNQLLTRAVFAGDDETRGIIKTALKKLHNPVFSKPEPAIA
jgi:hypothetical protein